MSGEMECQRAQLAVGKVQGVRPHTRRCNAPECEGGGQLRPLVVMPSTGTPVESSPRDGEGDSFSQRRPFAFPPESRFNFRPETSSHSPRIGFHVRPGTAFTLARNPQPGGGRARATTPCFRPPGRQRHPPDHPRQHGAPCGPLILTTPARTRSANPPWEGWRAWSWTCRAP